MGDQPEPVRLVIWDLDETFWRGTLTEGGIKEFVSEHHAIVKELARRGIISSICSKNDHGAVEKVLREQEIWDYFVLPSVSWEPKGPRLKRLIEDIGLRPATVLFIDDNHGNRAEAASSVPGIQVADDTRIFQLLDDPSCCGKSDPELKRLQQYKLVEQRRRDESKVGGNNEDFLRASNIRVSFEYDIEPHLARAVELINRTNQLNFTKKRLSEDEAEAKKELLALCKLFHYQAALVRVEDRYGDYGYCGFFLRSNGEGGGLGKLMHFCFSCRTLGMLVEKWVYDQLGMPQIEIVGDVLTDIKQQRSIDWIRFSVPGNDSPIEKFLPEVRLRGGCEINAVTHYFGPYTHVSHREGSFSRSPFFIQKDCSHHLVTPYDGRPEEEFLVFAEQFGFKTEDFETKFFDAAAPGTLLVYSGWGDCRATYKHRATERHLTPVLPGLYSNVILMSDQEIDDALSKRNLTDQALCQIRSAIATLKYETDFSGRPTEEMVRRRLTNIFSSVPKDCRVAALAIDEYWKEPNKAAVKNWVAIAYNRWLSEIATKFQVKVFQIGDYVFVENDRQVTSHFDRIVYFRLATAIIDWARRQNHCLGQR